MSEPVCSSEELFALVSADGPPAVKELEESVESETVLGVKEPATWNPLSESVQATREKSSPAAQKRESHFFIGHLPLHNFWFSRVKNL